MKAILLKNYYFYRRNYSEIISQIISSILQITPIFYMLTSEELISNDLFYVVVNYLLACCILNIAVGVSFEYFREIIQEKDIDLKLAGTPNSIYALSQTIFYFIMNVIIFLITIFIFILVINVDMNFKFSIFKFLGFAFGTFLFIINLISLTTALSFVVKKTKMFSFSSMICNFLLILSGCYNSINSFWSGLRILSYLNPFTYFVCIIKNFIFNENLILSNNKFYLSFAILTTVYWIIIRYFNLRFYKNN